MYNLKEDKLIFGLTEYIVESDECELERLWSRRFYMGLGRNKKKGRYIVLENDSNVISIHEY